MSSATDAAREIPESAVYPVEFSLDVPADTPRTEPATKKRTVKAPSRTQSFIVGWSDGADHLVGIGLETESGQSLFPRNPEDEYMAANNFTHPFPLVARFPPEQTFVAKFINNDMSNSHFVNAILITEERPESHSRTTAEVEPRFLNREQEGER